MRNKVVPQESPPRIAERWALGLLLLGALALRLVWLDRIPGNITADEADNLRLIFQVQETGEPALFGLDWKPAPAFSLYLFNVFLGLFGQTVFSLRLASATLSTAALIPFYALARRLVGAPAALGAAALLGSGRWYLHFSRSGWENVHTALYALLAAWALTVALERRRLAWFGLAGVAAALGLYGYYSGRLILPALLGYLAVLWARRRGERPLLAKGAAVLALTALLLFAPQGRTLVRDWDYTNRRLDKINVLQQPRPYLGQTTAVGILGEQLGRIVRGYFGLEGELFQKARYGPPGEPPYDLVTGVLFLAGVGVSLGVRRRTALWWCLLLGPLLGSQLLTIEIPNLARAVTAAPFVYLFVALSLQALHERLTFVPSGLMAGLVALIAVGNVDGYFDWIRSRQALRARQPVIEYAEYDLWQATLRRRYREGEPGFTIDQWRAVRRAGEPAGHIRAPVRERRGRLGAAGGPTGGLTFDIFFTILSPISSKLEWTTNRSPAPPGRRTQRRGA